MDRAEFKTQKENKVTKKDLIIRNVLWKKMNSWLYFWIQRELGHVSQGEKLSEKNILMSLCFHKIQLLINQFHLNFGWKMPGDHEIKNASSERISSYFAMHPDDGKDCHVLNTLVCKKERKEGRKIDRRRARAGRCGTTNLFFQIKQGKYMGTQIVWGPHKQARLVCEQWSIRYQPLPTHQPHARTHARFVECECVFFLRQLSAFSSWNKAI